MVQLSCEIKAISAPSWGLAGWLGLSLAKERKKNIILTCRSRAYCVSAGQKSGCVQISILGASRYQFWTSDSQVYEISHIIFSILPTIPFQPDVTCYLSVHNVLRGVINVTSGISEGHKVVLDFASPILRNISVIQFCHALFLFLNKTENFIHWIFFYFKFICFGFFFHKITQILALTK